MWWSGSSLRRVSKPSLRSGCSGFIHFPGYGFSRMSLLETVWKLKTGPVLESQERADRDQQALFGRTVLPEIRFNEPYSYFPVSLTNHTLGNWDNYSPLG